MDDPYSRHPTRDPLELPPETPNTSGPIRIKLGCNRTSSRRARPKRWPMANSLKTFSHASLSGARLVRGADRESCSLPPNAQQCESALARRTADPPAR